MGPTPGSEVNVAEQRRTPAEEVERLYNEAETATAKALEELVSRQSFGTVLVRVTENVMGLAQIANSATDLVVRNLRLAGRPDLVRLGRQLARTEDKLEQVLQEVERLSDQLAALQERQQGTGPNGGAASASGKARSRRTSA